MFLTMTALMLFVHAIVSSDGSLIAVSGGVVSFILMVHAIVPSKDIVFGGVSGSIVSFESLCPFRRHGRIKTLCSREVDEK